MFFGIVQSRGLVNKSEMPEVMSIHPVYAHTTNALHEAAHHALYVEVYYFLESTSPGQGRAAGCAM